MPLKKDVIQVPLAGKLDESVNPKLMQPGSVQLATNCRYTKEGLVRKMYGNELVTTTVDSANDQINVHTMLPSADSLLVAGHLENYSTGRAQLDEGYQVLALNGQEDKFYKTGLWQPIEQSKQPLNYSDELIWSVETTVHSGYVYSAVVFLDPVTAAPREYGIRLCVVEQSTGHVIIDNTRLAVGKTQPRFVNVGTHVHLYVANTEPIGSVDASMSLYVFDTATPDVIPSPATIYVDTGASGILPLYDACYHDDPTYGDCSVFFTGGNNAGAGLYGRIIDESGTPQRAAYWDGTRAPDGHMAAKMCPDYATGNNYIVVVHGEGANVRCIVFDDTLGVHTANYVAIAGVTPEILAVCEDPADSYYSGSAFSAYRIFCQRFVGFASPGTGNFREIRSERRRFDTAAIVGSADYILQHWRIATRPFVHEGVARIWCSFDTGLADSQPRAGLFHWGKEDPTATQCTPELNCVWGVDTFERPLQPANITPPPTFPFPPAGNVTAVSDDFFWGSYEAVRVLSIGVFPLTSKSVKLNKLGWSGSRYVPARVGDLVVLPGGRMSLFDGQTHDYGFCHAPEITGVVDGGAGTLSTGTYSYTAIYAWTDAAGMLHRSAPANIVTFTPGAANRSGLIGIKPILAGDWHKMVGNSHVKIEIYRNTQTTPAVFNRVAVVDNQYLAGAQITHTDTSPDSVVVGQPLLYTNGGVLPAGSPPPTQIVHKHRNRLFAIDDEDKRRLVYTKELETGLAPEWSSVLVHLLPRNAYAVDTVGSDLVVFCEDSVYTLRGNGIDIFGRSGSYYEELRMPTAYVVEKNLVKNTNIGLVFYSGASIYLMAGQSIRELSSPIKERLANDVIYRIEEDPDEKTIRFLYNSGMHLYNYEFDRWSDCSFGNLLDMARTDDKQLWFWEKKLGSKGKLLKENKSKYLHGSTGSTYGIAITTPWLRLGNINGYQRVYECQILGDYYGAHGLQIITSTDYAAASKEVISKSYSTSFEPYLVSWVPAIGRCQAIRIQLSEIASGDSAGPAFTSLELIAGFKGPSVRNKDGI